MNDNMNIPGAHGSHDNWEIIIDFPHITLQAEVDQQSFLHEQIYIRAFSEFLIVQCRDCNNSDSIYWPDKCLE